MSDDFNIAHDEPMGGYNEYVDYFFCREIGNGLFSRSTTKLFIFTHNAFIFRYWKGNQIPFLKKNYQLVINHILNRQDDKKAQFCDKKLIKNYTFGIIRKKHWSYIGMQYGDRLYYYYCQPPEVNKNHKTMLYDIEAIHARLLRGMQRQLHIHFIDFLIQEDPKMAEELKNPEFRNKVETAQKADLTERLTKKKHKDLENYNPFGDKEL